MEARKSKKHVEAQEEQEAFEHMQESFDHVMGAMRQFADAVSKGIEEYQESSKESSKGGEKEAIRDFIPNLGKGMSKMIEESSSIPEDMAKAINTKRVRKLMKRIVNLLD